MNRIKCNVSSCKYNDDGNLCKAEEIKVKNNTGTAADMEFGILEDADGASTSTETCCETFAPRKK